MDWSGVACIAGLAALESRFRQVQSGATIVMEIVSKICSV